MNLPFPHPPHGEASPRRDMGQVRQRMGTTTAALQQQIVRVRRPIRLIAFFAGLLLISLLVPASPTRHALGYGGGGSAPANPTCGQPAQVFAKLLKGVRYTLPTKAQLRLLPTPKQQPITTTADVNYDPATNQLCTGGWAILMTRFENPGPTVQGSTNAAPTDGGNLVTTALSGVWTSFQQWLSDSLQSIFQDVETLGFLFATPAGLSYQNGVVLHLQPWFLVVTDAALSLFLIIGGYRYLFGAYTSMREFLPALILAAIIADFGPAVLGQFIDLSNAICQGIQGVFATAGFGDLTVFFGLLNWVAIPEYLILIYLIEMICLVLLCGQMLLRLAFLCLLLAIAPVGLFLCFGGGVILPGARQWGTLWAQAFVATLIAQPLQIICLGLSSALVASFGVSTDSPIVPLVGIAAIFLAWKIPDLLLSSVIRSRVLSSESSNDLVQNVVSTVQTGTEMVALVAA